MQETTDAGVEAPTILELLHQDHEETKDLFEKILEGADTDGLAETFRELHSALLAHAKAEEKCFYSHFLEEDDESRFFALKADVEHGLAEDLLDRLNASTEKGSDEWLAQCVVLKELVEHHVDEEEGEGFEIAQEIFDEEELTRLGAEFQREKSRLLAA